MAGRSGVRLLVLWLSGCLATAGAAEVEAPITANDRAHWSFKPVVRHEPPTSDDDTWSRTDVDRFILAALDARGLQPMPEADRATLLRRVTFDLTGLPPTLGELDAFLADESPVAYERQVDRLLASPAYGERWGMHWLDLARFAESDGFEHDHVRPNAWRYRDWVIEALNNDLPFDEFVRQQVAADELYPGDSQAALATGFLLCGPDMPDINLKEERRHSFLNDMTGTVGATLLGLQMGCAACHDHKYDPVSLHDFYRFRAFFESAELFREHELPTPEERRAREEFATQRAARWKALEAEIKRLKASADADATELARLEKEFKRVKAEEPPSVTMGRVVRPSRVGAGATYVWLRGSFRQRGPEVQPDVLRVVSLADSVDVPASDPPVPLQPRARLARWVTDPRHPLTARVLVNRVWQHHFGRGLVGTSSDFGAMGDLPTHPELLDWLASEFVAQNWSLKRLHRLLVTSSVYRTASQPAAAPARWEALLAADPENRLLGRMRRQRLEGEAIRDAMLQIAGRLNREAGGPGVRPPLPPEVTDTLLLNQWPVTEDPAQHDRRSIYLFVRRNLRYPLFEVFDRPDTNQSCPQRNQTTIAPQALQLLNSEFSLECAEDLAERLRVEAGGDPQRLVDLACRKVFARPATPATDRLLRQFLRESESDTAVTDLCLALFNSNEFVYVD